MPLTFSSLFTPLAHLFRFFAGTRLLAMDDDLRHGATECIQNNFAAVLETREFHQLPTIKLELIGESETEVSSWSARVFLSA